MIFTYNKTTKKISTYEETDFKTHNILERQHIEKWVEDDPEILGEELLIITTEYDQFDKTDERLDLLAIDKNGNIVIVELKRDDSGKSVELQAIKYAAYCSTLTFNKIQILYQEYLSKKGKPIDQESAETTLLAFINNGDFEELNDKPRIILVSKEYRPEVTASVLWLRKFGIDIRCVKLTPYEMDKNTIAFESTILIPLPEAESYIIRSEEKENSEHTLSVSQGDYLKFYTDLITAIKTQVPLSFSNPGPRNYYQIPTGISGVHYEWGFHGRPRNSLGVELHFEKTNKELNEGMLKSLLPFKNKIEQETGESVIIDNEFGKKWTRFFILKKEGMMTDDLKKWAVNNMSIFYNILQPELEKLK